MAGVVWGMAPEQSGFWGCPNKDPSFPARLGTSNPGLQSKTLQGRLLLGSISRSHSLFPSSAELVSPLPLCLSHGAGLLPGDKNCTNTPRF